MFGCVLSRVVERCGALTDLAMEAKCDVLLKWWSVMDAHKTRAMRVRSTGGVVLCGDNVCTQWVCAESGAYSAADEHGSV